MMIRQFSILLIIFTLSNTLYGLDSTQNTPEKREKPFAVSCALDTVILTDYLAAETGRAAFFRFYVNNFFGIRVLSFGFNFGITYDDSSYYNYTLYSLPFLVSSKLSFRINRHTAFMEIAGGTAFNYEELPLPFSYFSVAAEGSVGLSFVVFRNLDISIIGKFYINDLLMMMPRTYVGVRCELFL